LAARRIKVVANAGGVNPAACKARVAQVLAERGVALEIATVTGDDILGRLDELRAAGALDLETGRPLPAHALSANAYLGAFPIVECEPDGSFTVTKPGGTGGVVAPDTVGEQITYEVHDPARYVLPDVVCDFTQVRLAELGPDRVRVTGARGLPPPADYKASIT